MSATTPSKSAFMNLSEGEARSEKLEVAELAWREIP
jgi:hypothetical protein